MRGRSGATLELMIAAGSVLHDFDGSMSTRQVYYQLVSRGAVPNNDRSYDRVQRLLVSMRRDGFIPYHRIVDRTRSMHQRGGWDGAADILDSCAKQYRRNRWSDQDVVVMIACEKQALEGVFSEICDEYGASLWVLRGYGSLGFYYEWAREIQRQVEAGHRVVVSYFGDHDPSGLNIELKARDGILEQGGRVYNWQRAGLLFDDLERFDLINIPVKPSDSRAREYLSRFGDHAAELDALPPDELQLRIRNAIEEHLDADAWNQILEVESAERESIRQVAGAWNQALAAVEGIA